ncbi:hypothetical protein E2F47_09005 [Mycobacterium eburneum]|nr:hypothetical protein [Mycobacterium eburneum]TDH56019.1 hypothetical protein E2F47_09005 [Mycobacterium eburneum]
MTPQVFAAIEGCAARLRSSDRLDAAAVAVLRGTGVARMLQPEDYGGFATHPGDFAEAVMTLAALHGPAGWVAGMVGVAGWQLAMAPRRVRDEVWEADADTWVTSVLEPAGTLTPAADGYRLTGCWPAGLGIDHGDWVLLGARLDGGPRRVHVLVPRAELRIVAESHVVVAGAAVPGYRVLDYHALVSGAAAAGLRNPIYRMPFRIIYPLGVGAAVIGMAEGALARHPHDGAAAEIRAARVALLDTVTKSFFAALDGGLDTVDSALRAGLCEMAAP